MTKSIEIAKVFGTQPANDNAGRLPLVPIFTALLTRHDVTRTDALVYGAMVALHRAGADTTVRQIAELAGLSTEDESRQCRKVIRKLERVGLVLRKPRERHEDAIVYTLVGPDVECECWLRAGGS